MIELRASIIIGSGSLSFELIRALTERLPVMICPRWVATPTQPIAIEDVLEYLLAALDLPGSGSRTFEIGGPDVVSYGGIMRKYARQRGLRRLMISVPLLTPYLSSLWLGLVTPVYARVGRKLVEGLRNPTVVRTPAASTEFSIRPRPLAEAIQRALAYEDGSVAATRWSDALSAGGPVRTWGGVRFANRIVDSRTAEVDVPTEMAFRLSHASAARLAGTTATGYGDCGDGLICWSVASACGGKGATRWTCGWARPLISGAWRPWSRADDYGWPPRCDFRAAHGWSSRSRPHRQRVDHPADGDLRSCGAWGVGLLVRPLPGSSACFFRYVERNCPSGSEKLKHSHHSSW